MTSLLDNNTAAVLTATGQWAEADQLLTELVGQSAANVTRYLHWSSWNWPSAAATASAQQSWLRSWRSRPRTPGWPGRCTRASPSRP